jgi:hypothetical protein
MHNRKPSPARRKPKCRYCKRVLRPGPFHCCARRHREAFRNSVSLAERVERQASQPTPY